MTAIAALTEPFEGTDGVTITTANTGIDNLSGAGTIKFKNSAAYGSTSAEVVCAANNHSSRFDFTSVTTLYADFGFNAITLDSAAGAVAVCNWYNSAGSGTGKIGDLRLTYVDATHYTLSLRDNSTTRWTSTSLTTATWYRIQIKIIPGSSTGHRVYIYNTPTSDTADQDSGTQTATVNAQTAVDNIRLGVVSSSTMTVRFDGLLGDDAQLVTRATGAVGDALLPVVFTLTSAGSVDSTDALYVRVGGAWVVATDRTRVGGAWV